MKVLFRVDPAYLAGANLGVDPEASAAAFGAALESALRAAWPSAEVEVVLGAPHGAAITGAADVAAVQREVDGLARGLRGAGHWIAYR
ncbi:MAG: hypothetical protein CMN30_23170 [Sandaracinus sp.]|nr:hypothetical protein [Sandaracinus sp.]